MYNHSLPSPFPVNNLPPLLLLIFLCGLQTACAPNLPPEIEEAYQSLPNKIDFNFHVRPILSDRCYSCHGPDDHKREADLRLDIEKMAKGELSENKGKYAVSAGSLKKSQLFHRIISRDETSQMPPPDANLDLSEREKAILIKWIEQGAQWKEHWAFSPPQKKRPPQLALWEDKVKHPIDRFIFKKLEQESLAPAPEAQKERLLRRVSMDLRGLPPSIEEIDAFLADERPDAYERLVDRLLETDAHAERLAMEWMDVSRYADSHGMHADGWRMMWPWRDWVIKAFKENMPYDQFVSWQLAGDLYPDASKEQKLATAFNRNHTMTAEGGAIDEEFRLSYVFDRTETFGTAFLGLTMNCARCHNHKFDPISQKEYYQLTAFFNNIRELGMTGNDGNFGPLLSLAPAQTQKALDSLKQLIQIKEKELQLTETELLSQVDFIKNIPDVDLNSGLIDYYPLDQASATDGDSYIFDRNLHCTTRGQPKLVEGKVGKALAFNGEYDELYLQNNINFEWPESFSAALWVNTRKQEKDKTQTILGTAGAKNNFGRGWELYLDDANRVNLRITSAYPANYLHIQSRFVLPLNQWIHLAFSYDGSGKANGMELYVNGKVANTTIKYDRLYKSIKTTAGRENRPVDRAIRVAKSYRGNTGDNGVFLGKMDEIYLYKRVVDPLEVFRLFEKEDGRSLEDFASDRPDLLARRQLIFHPEILAKKSELRSLRFSWLKLMDTIPEIMVMEEMETPRTAFAYQRGEYDAPMYEVAAGVPKTLLDFPAEYPQNRLGLAKWLFHPEHPLTARVTVNRYWQMLFGRGLVNTPQDFGVQGELPTHPELLDWLALEFIEQDWDLRRLLKSMVLSHAYRQSSQISSELLEKDPENRLLARGGSYRLPAEMIRDNALAASGLLARKTGGASVRPYQPEGLWIEKGNFSHKLLRYKVSQGDSLYRRSMYTFIKRTSPPPAMTAFDAPNRTVCTVRRENTNTPLQALVLLNDPQFVEAARVLAERMQAEGGDEPERQIDFAFRLTTGRHAKAPELALLKELYLKQLTRFQQETSEAQAILQVGEYKSAYSFDPAQTAALAIVANTILNHDDAYMKR